jgi:organic hydroperoxide reductase OsmC/OhrA
MSEYVAKVIWNRGDQEFLDNRYSRGHMWEFDGGARVAASASPQILPAPLSVEANVDPEEAFVAALSSCHMLFFLSIAAKQGFVIDAYVDDAVGSMEKNADGAMAMTRVRLRPSIAFSGKKRPTREQLEDIHHRAHGLCFIANSVKTEVVTEIR